MKMQRIRFTLMVMGLALALAACTGNQATPVPTVSVADVQTMAVSTFSAGLTQTAAAMPTAAPSETPQPTSTVLAFNTFVPLNGSGTPVTALSSPTASCYGLVFANVETIPDGTKLKAGSKFTKTWTVQNTGGCAWQPGFKFSLISGNAMGGSTYILQQTVNPQAQFQISVPMIAPSTTGESKGTWRMQDSNGSFFGDSIWVDIIVQAPSPTKTPSATATP